MNENPGGNHALHDYHIHSLFSCDSEASMEQMCVAAIQAGIPEIGFSDHFDLHPDDPFQDYLDLESWWESFSVCKQKFSGELILRAGIEVGEPHRFAQRVNQLALEYPWDFILGSLHWVDDISVFDKSFFRSNERDSYLAYFLELERLVDEGEFDILAHFDVVKRYGYEYYGTYQPEDYHEPIRRILRRLADRGQALEINTATLRRSIQRPSPDAILLQWFREEGGRSITLGSDAHSPQEVGFGLSSMRMMVQSAGFTGLAQYENRQCTIVDFDKPGR
jgi:histidinol-phosphatase (PHP family)